MLWYPAASCTASDAAHSAVRQWSTLALSSLRTCGGMLAAVAAVSIAASRVRKSSASWDQSTMPPRCATLLVVEVTAGEPNVCVHACPEERQPHSSLAVECASSAQYCSPTPRTLLHSIKFRPSKPAMRETGANERENGRVPTTATRRAVMQDKHNGHKEED